MRKCTLVLLVVLAAAKNPAWAEQGLYRLEPFTLQQSIRDGRNEAQRLTGRFLTMTLSVMARNSAARYEHLLPKGPDELRSFALKIKPAFLFERNAPLGHPFEQPLSRIVLYWGCGEQPGKGQPKVIDAADFDNDQLARYVRHVTGLSVPTQQSRSGRGREETVAHRNMQFPDGVDMRGLHEIRAGLNRTQFIVSEQGDFLPPVNITEAHVSDVGVATVRWERVPGASAYFVNMYVHPSKSPVALVWTSSRVPETGFALTERHPGGDEVIRLRNQGILMQDDSRECTIPSVVTRYRDHAMSIQVHAFGAETVIAPASGKERSPATAVRIAPRATTTTLLLKLRGGSDDRQAW